MLNISVFFLAVKRVVSAPNRLRLPLKIAGYINRLSINKFSCYTGLVATLIYLSFETVS